MDFLKKLAVAAHSRNVQFRDTCAAACNYIDLQKSFVPSVQREMWCETFLGNYIATTDHKQFMQAALTVAEQGLR